MKPSDPMQQEIASLEAQIRHHQRLYYDLSAPEISDSEFDVLWGHLQVAAPDSPVLKERSQFDADVPHLFPMGSLEKFKTIEDVSRNLGHGGIGVITAKLDGASLTVHYRNGRMVMAVTRGRTETGKGKDVTANALMITSIPRVIDFDGTCEVRGECVIVDSDWAMVLERYPKLANPRNAASGALQQQDPRETAAKRLTFVACKVIVHGGSKPLDTQPLDKLQSWGFQTPKSVEVDLSDIEALRTAIADWLADRASLPYWNDGIVIRIKDDQVYNKLGFSGVCPKGACAYKFENERAKTVLRRIECETGRLGFVTPVAVFDPVELGGANVERCSLHNWEWMRTHGNPSIGAEIVVEKCGDIIPGLAGIEKPGNGDTCEPTTCPSCGSKLSKVFTNDGLGRKLKCLNGWHCKVQFRDAVLNVLRKLEVKGLAEKSLDAIIDAGLVENPWDIFGVTQDGLIAAGYSSRESQIIIEALRGVEAKPTNILAAVGVEMWGRRMFAKLQRMAPNFTDERLLAGDFPVQEVASAPQVGSVRAEVLDEAFHDGGWGREFLAGLLKWVRPTAKEIGDTTKAVGGKLSGKSFLITGTLSKPRKLIEADIVAAGGSISSGVSKNLDFLVVGEDSGSKLAKAQKLGVKTLSEAGLYGMIGAV